MDDKDFVKEALTVLWNLCWDSDVRKLMISKDAASLYALIREKHHSNVELLEVVEIATRNLSTSIAMDPLIEQCILKNACTYSVTGSKTFLLQVWYDCYTCNLRSRYGCCAVCADTCHKGHRLSNPKFSGFYCDCGHGALKKKGITCKSVRTLKELGLQRRRDRDEGVHSDSDEEPDPIPIIPGPPRPNSAPKGKGKPVPSGGGKRIATLFDH